MNGLRHFRACIFPVKGKTRFVQRAALTRATTVTTTMAEILFSVKIFPGNLSESGARARAEALGYVVL